MTPEARLAQSYTDAEVAFWHFAPEINVGSDAGDWGYNGRVADIGRSTRMTHKQT
jgi:hypothetical protein